MQFLGNLKIGVRLAAGFAILIAALLTVTLVGRFGMKSIEARLIEATEDRVPKVLKLNEVIDNVNEIARSVRNMALLTEADKKKAEAQRITEARAANSKILDDLDPQITTAKGREFMKSIQSERSRFNAELDQVMELAGKDDLNATRDRLLGSMREVQLAYMKTLYAFADFQVELMKESMNRLGF